MQRCRWWWWWRRWWWVEVEAEAEVHGATDRVDVAILAAQDERRETIEVALIKGRPRRQQQLDHA